jgi:hypothetical protein
VTIIATVRLRVNENPADAERRVQALLEHGSARDAFDDAGIDLAHLRVKGMDECGEAESILKDICNSFETEGCEGCGTVSTTTIDKARVFLGWNKLDDSEDE